MAEKETAVVLYRGEADRHAVLARYGSAKLVRIQAERLQMVEKGKNGLEWPEALLVAQASLATGLSPFEPQPELWHWIAIKNGARQLTIMRGRDGTIRLAEEAARRDGTYLMPPKFTQIIDSREKQELGFGPDDLVWKAQIFDHRTADEYYRRRKDLKEEGLAPDEIDARLGGEPASDVGYGYMPVKEMSEINQKSYGKLKFPHVNRVQKRAQVEALKKRWASHINMAALAELAPIDDESYSVEGEWREIAVDDLKDVTPKEDPLPGDPARGDPAAGKKIEAADIGQRPYDPTTVLKGVQSRLKKHKGARKTQRYPGEDQMDYFEVALWQLSECFLDPKFDAEPTGEIVLDYLFGHSEFEPTTGAESRALLDWLDPTRNGIGDLTPNILSVQEARLIWKENIDGS